MKTVFNPWTNDSQSLDEMSDQHLADLIAVLTLAVGGPAGTLRRDLRDKLASDLNAARDVRDERVMLAAQ